MTFTAQMRLTITLFVIGLVSVVGIVSYAAGESNERAIPLHERVLNQCESVEVGTDVGAMLHSNGYNLEFVDENSFIAHSPGCAIVSEEDGSGRQFDENYNTVRTFPEDTFYWNCVTQGNRYCG